jgi:hypothetical protein
MRVRVFILIACISMFGGAAWTHGGEEHVIGTVAKVDQTSITVKTTTNKMVTVAVVPQSTLTKNKAAMTIGDLKVGDRVVIHAKEPEEGKLVADTVEFSSAKASPATGANH